MLGKLVTGDELFDLIHSTCLHDLRLPGVHQTTRSLSNECMIQARLIARNASIDFFRTSLSTLLYNFGIS